MAEIFRECTDRQNIPSLGSQLFSDPDFADVTLVSVGGEHLAGHRAVLGRASTFLRSLLYGSMLQATFLFLPHPREVVEALLQVLYLGHTTLGREYRGDLATLARQLGVHLPPNTLKRDEENVCELFSKDGEEGTEFSELTYEENTLQGEEEKALGLTPEEETKFSEMASEEEVSEVIENESTDSELNYEEKETQAKNNGEKGFGHEAFGAEQIQFDKPSEIETLDLDKTPGDVALYKYMKVESEAQVQSLEDLQENRYSSLKSKPNQSIKLATPKIQVIKPNSDSKYECNECDNIYVCWDNLRKHKLSAHEGFTFNCEQCEKAFSRPESLKQHLRFAHDGIQFKCEKCGKTCMSSKNLKNHQDQEKSTCSKCNLVFCNILVLNRHKKVHSPFYNGELFCCTICAYQTMKPTRLKSHIAVLHEGKRLTCDQCSYQHKRMSGLTEHKRVVHEGFRYKCEQCDWEGNSNSSLVKHIQIKHEGLIYKCTKCNYEVRHKRALEEHVRLVHEKADKLKCKLCGHEVMYAGSLKRHINKEHKKYRYKCDKCTFFTKFCEKLKLHKSRGIHPEAHDLIQCHPCEETFSSVTRLNTHMINQHNQEKTQESKAVNPTQKRRKFLRNRECEKEKCCVKKYKKKLQNPNMTSGMESISDKRKYKTQEGKSDVKNTFP